MSVYSLQYPKDESGERRYPAHNSYVEVLVGTGTIGFIVFGLIILLVLRNFHISKKRFQLNGEEGIMLLIDAYRLSLIAILISFFFLSSLYIKYLWIILALSQGALKLSKEISVNQENAVTAPLK